MRAHTHYHVTTQFSTAPLSSTEEQGKEVLTHTYTVTHMDVTDKMADTYSQTDTR